MKKFLLVGVLLCVAQGLLGGFIDFKNDTDFKVDVEVKQIAETKIGCKPKKATIGPKKEKRLTVPCIIKKFRYRKKGSKKWSEKKSTDGRSIVFKQDGTRVKAEEKRRGQRPSRRTAKPSTPRPRRRRTPGPRVDQPRKQPFITGDDLIKFGAAYSRGF